MKPLHVLGWILLGLAVLAIIAAIRAAAAVGQAIANATDLVTGTVKQLEHPVDLIKSNSFLSTTWLLSVLAFAI